MATASCVPLDTLTRIYASRRDRGAVLTQSYLVDGDGAQARALSLLAGGADAHDVLSALVEPAFDADFERRQYAVLDMTGGVATHTGSAANDHASHAQRVTDEHAVVVAGNFLSGPDVLERMLSGFAGDGCDLEARLYAALVAAGQPDSGDARCIEQARPAQSAWLVAERDGEDIDLRVEEVTDDPIATLGDELAAFRQAHPCPMPPFRWHDEDIANPSDEDIAAGTSAGCKLIHPAPDSSPWWGFAVALALWRRRATR